MATVSLAKDANEAYFSWFDEPGQYNWQFTRNKSDRLLLNVTINGFSDDRHKLDEKINFVVWRYFWIDLVILEVDKVAQLLSYSHYKDSRYSHTFPWAELKRLRQYRNSQN
ncbi:MAG: hypothetical protein AAGF83_01260 [Cyanobacteria bacterium P01_G01_bin.67]